MREIASLFSKLFSKFFRGDTPDPAVTHECTHRDKESKFAGDQEFKAMLLET